MPSGQHPQSPGRAALLALTLASVVGLLSAGCASKRAVTAPTTTSRPAATTTTTTTLPAGAAPYTWRVDSSPALDLGGGPSSTLSAIVSPGASSEWLVAGTQSSPSGVTTATVWTSPDGIHWSRSALPKAAGVVATTARAAANWGNRQVVVGSAGTGAAMTAAVWVSQGPGQPFLAVAGGSAFEAPSSVPGGGEATGVVMDTVAAGALGVFAGGTVDGRTTMWYSSGGERWEALPGADDAINSFRGAVVNDIVSTPSGIFAAGSYLDGSRLSGEMWSSSDGIHWDNDGGWFAGLGDRVITSLVDMSESGNAEPGTPGPTGMLAVGGVRVGTTWQPASWISPNGVSWSQTSESFPLDDEPPGTSGALVYAATGSDGRLIAVGGSPGRQRVWQSSAGLAWSSVALPAGAARAPRWHLGLVGASGHTIVVADNLPGQPYVLVNDGTSWRQPSAGGGFGSPLRTAVPTSLVDDDGALTMSVQVTDPGLRLGAGRTRAAVLVSSNGKAWHMANADAFPGATVNQLLAVPDGILAVGSEPLAGAQGLTGAFARLSTDGGAAWPDELISPDSIGGPGPGIPAATTTTTGTGTTLGPGVSGAAEGAPSIYMSGPLAAVTAGRVGDSQYVVGEAGGQAVDWYSPDGQTWEAPRPLDTSPELGTEVPMGSCTAGDSAVVVGEVTTTGRGSSPAAWTSTDGSSWTAGTFAPAPGAGTTTSVDGCLSTGNGFLAYGETGYGGVEQPELWASSDGVTWQQTSSAFSGLSSGQSLGDQAAPLDDIAWGTSTWLGLSGLGDLPSQVWPSPVGGQAGAEPTLAGLWSSVDAGNSWQEVATAGDPAFTGALFTQLGAATYVGQQPVVAGTVDGHLRVWVGTPTPLAG